MVEFALAFPIFFALLLAAIQFGLLLVWYGDEVRLTRDSVRWLALNPTSSDLAVALQIESLMNPTTMPTLNVPPVGLSPGTCPPSFLNNGCAAYQIGKLTATFTPCVPDSATPPNCTNPNRSPDGGTAHVELSYNASNIIFLPLRLSFPFITFQAPTALPLYDDWMATE